MPGPAPGMQNIHEHKSIKPQPAIRTLSSPAHLLFQLIKLTTLPYLISQLISSSSSSKPIPISTSATETSNQNEKSYSKTSISSSEPTNQEHGNRSIQWPSLLPSSASKSYHSKFNTKRTYSTFPGYTPLQLTSKIHDRIRSTEKDDQDLKELRSLLVQLDKPKPITLHLALLKLRPILLSSRLIKSSKPDLIQLSQVWKSTAVSEMVDSWKSSKDQSHRKPNERNDYEIRSLMNVRKNLFLKNGPRLCDCLKVKRRKLGSSRDDELFEYFKSHLHKFDRISRLRFIDICLARRRWDLATEIMFEEKYRKEIYEEPKLKNRSLRQVTGLLLHLRSTTDDLEKSKELLNSVEIICEKLKDGKEMNGLRLNRLSLDVICRFASIQISRTNRKGKAYKVRKQCREFLRSLIHFDHLHRSEPWLKIRLLDHFSQFKATQLQFDELYDHSFKNTSHPSHLSPRMARIILKASSNFKQVKNLNEDLIKRSVIEISNQRDQRPLIDYLLGSDQLSTDPEILNQTFKVCEQVSNDYDHLLYRLSKLSSFDLIDLRNFSIPIQSNDPNLFAKTLILIKLYKKSKRNRKMNEEDLPKRFENGLIKLIRQTIQRLWKMKRKENELRKIFNCGLIWVIIHQYRVRFNHNLDFRFTLDHVYPKSLSFRSL
ncbi:hypothetical protein DFH28DRAFT_929162 [Melampsora americana]|nr:hypothetical protein DFH28DRAFT_929162 [Melampsora americana]